MGDKHSGRKDDLSFVVVLTLAGAGIVIDKVAIVDIVAFTTKVAVSLPDWCIVISATMQLSIDGLNDVLGEFGENRTELFSLYELLIWHWNRRCHWQCRKWLCNCRWQEGWQNRSCHKHRKCAIVRQDWNAIKNESHSFVNLVDSVRLVKVMVRVSDVELSDDSVPKYGIETMNIGMELVNNAEVIFLDEVRSNHAESEMIGSEVLEVVDAKFLTFAD
jgi:hypothetical protein